MSIPFALLAVSVLDEPRWMLLTISLLGPTEETIRSISRETHSVSFNNPFGFFYFAPLLVVKIQVFNTQKKFIWVLPEAENFANSKFASAGGKTASRLCRRHNCIQVVPEAQTASRLCRRHKLHPGCAGGTNCIQGGRKLHFEKFFVCQLYFNCIGVLVGGGRPHLRAPLKLHCK